MIELKVEEFKHYNFSQLNTFLNFSKDKIVWEDDNPPVGILLVTDKDDALVQYAGAGIDNQLFVSKYLMELPTKKQLEDFMKQELRKLRL